MSRVVTVAIPVLNGATYLDEVLSAVRAQVVDRDVEIVIVDSGSTDGSLGIARNHGARVHEIPKSEFSHGGTRNLLMELASGSHVAFLTQDATPADDRWLAALLEGFEQAPDVAAVFGPHEPRAEAGHVIKAEMERHFANWRNDAQAIDVQRLDRSPSGIAVYLADPGRLTFLSSVNCCIERTAWEKIRFQDVRYAEDQLFGRELIEAGYAKVFHPDARVLHSHHYGAVAFLRRYFDEYRGLREVLGYQEPAGPISTVRAIRGLCAADREWLGAHGFHGVRLATALVASVRHHTFRMIGAISGSRAGRVPPGVRKRLSLEGRSEFAPLEIPASSLLTDKDVLVRLDWGWEFVRTAYPSRALALDTQHGSGQGPFTLAWVVPPWNVGSGGHAVIFHLIAELERRGHRCAIFVFDPFGQEPRHGAALRAEVIEHFVPIEAQVFVGLGDFDSADVAFATNWWTAYPVRDLPRCREKVYFVQDFEPAFFPTSVESLWAEATYRMGYRCVAYTPWLANLLRQRYALEVAEIDFGTDTETYTFGAPESREPGLVAVYARHETPRRAVELAIAALATLFERRPGVRVVLFGSNHPMAAPFPCANLGVAPPRTLATLYRRASAGLVFSLTNLSIVTQEMMASGLPVVELDGANVSSVLGASGELARLAAPQPDAIAEELEVLLDRPEEAAEMTRRARRFVEQRTWRHASEQLESAISGFLAEPREETVVGARRDDFVLSRDADVLSEREAAS
jgi:O-antigen biosynthesis protein